MNITTRQKERPRPVLQEVGEQSRSVRAAAKAFKKLGGTKIMGILLTMDAEQGVAAIRMLNPREVIPIHYNDYEVFKSPL